ncbi:MAG: hypothetical protein HY698_16905 [Deltaproteobacteria bacterium]|nr:hypothetical protein [Deltaproteobacteria bacterium]
MPGVLLWRVTGTLGEKTLLSLSGEFNESTRVEELCKIKGPLVVDLGGVNRINSTGVRALLTWLEGASRNGTVEAERCSHAIVSQLNMLPELARLVTVTSFLAPMECPKCFQEQEVLVRIPPDRHPRFPEERCGRCDEEMRLSEPRERYLAFLNDEC